MISTENWMESSAAIAMGKTLLHSLWQGGLIAITLNACLRFTNTSRIRYAAACVALVLAIAASIATFGYLAPDRGDRSGLHRMMYPVAPLPNVGTAENEPAGLAPSLLQQALPWITPIWIIGVLLFNFRQAASWIAARRLRRRGVCPAPDGWQQRLASIRTQLKMTIPVVLLESCLTQVPLVVGHMRPAILVPLGLLTGLPASQVELILMHELAHIRRCDYVINLIQTFIEGIMFYNPGVWWISKQIRAEREHCCDDFVISATSNAQAYAAALASLELNRSQSSVLAIAATGGSLMKRIRRVLNQPEPVTSLVAPIFAAALVVVAITGILVARPHVPAPEVAVPLPTAVPAPAPPVQLPQSPIPNPVPAGFQNSLRKWLEEDVSYIITQEERAIFQTLSTDEERERFIEQFWLRRDPTPGTVDNEFKDEHYLRIQYANQNFQTRLPGVPGWKTDRGRIYIMYGKPDEIESHPSGGTYDRPIAQGGGTTRTFPFEIWRYRYIEGIGNNLLIQFVDSKGTAEFPRVTQ